MKTLPVTLVLLISAAFGGSTSTDPIPARFDSVGADRQAILALLHAYTEAVSDKDQARFETLLLSKSIPFSAASVAIRASDPANDTRNYENFRRAVFEGTPFTQRFQNIRIQQDGSLASVSLVFVNTTATDSTWGWKTMQLLKVSGSWKIASEFFTGHRGIPDFAH
jgi:hypothetical protein